MTTFQLLALIALIIVAAFGLAFMDWDAWRRKGDKSQRQSHWHD